MYCKNCGALNAEDVAFCANCGAEMQAEVEAPVVESAYEPVEAPAAEPVVVEQEAKDPGKTLGIVSLILGIAAIVLGTVCSCGCACLGSILPCVLAVVGIILGIIGMNKSKAAGFSNKLALIGIILSGVSVLVMVIFVIINAVIGGASSLFSMFEETPSYGYDDYYYYY